MVRQAPANATDKLNAAQIAWYAQQAGFTGTDLVTAVAVALAESGGRINAIGGPNSNGSYDYGVWQINDRAHPDLITADAQWWVAGFNAQWAFKVYRDAGNSFSPWSTFTSGAYTVHLGSALLGARNPESSGMVEAGPDTVITRNPIEDLVAPFKAIAGAVFKTAAWVSNPKNGVRTAQVVIGGTLVVGALVLVARPYLTNAVTSAVPVGNVIKQAAKGVAK